MIDIEQDIYSSWVKSTGKKIKNAGKKFKNALNIETKKDKRLREHKERMKNEGVPIVGGVLLGTGVGAAAGASLGNRINRKRAEKGKQDSKFRRGLTTVGSSLVGGTLGTIAGGASGVAISNVMKKRRLKK